MQFACACCVKQSELCLLNYRGRYRLLDVHLHYYISSIIHSTVLWQSVLGRRISQPNNSSLPLRNNANKILCRSFQPVVSTGKSRQSEVVVGIEGLNQPSTGSFAAIIGILAVIESEVSKNSYLRLSVSPFFCPSVSLSLTFKQRFTNCPPGAEVHPEEHVCWATAKGRRSEKTRKAFMPEHDW